MAKYASLAERYRAHNRAFKLALEMGCTPKEAECELERREAHARWQETHAKLVAQERAGRLRADDTDISERQVREDQMMMRG